MKADPFEGNFLLPLSLMEKESALFLRNIVKHKDRENLMNETIPKLLCNWFEVIQFSTIDPQIIVNELKAIKGEFEVPKKDYFKIHIEEVVDKYDAVILTRPSDQIRGLQNIHEDEVRFLDRSYEESFTVPENTIHYWESIKKHGGKYLMFPFVPHILIKGKIDVSQCEVRTLG